MMLSQKQSDIVTAPVGVAMQVLASAGSGKTRVLTERIRFILANSKKDRVLALTFTNKAAEEMQQRLADTDRITDATVHAVAQRVLEQYSHTIGLPAQLHIFDRDKDRMAVFLQSLRDDNVDIDAYLNVADHKEKRNRHSIMQSYMDAFAAIKRGILSEADVAQQYVTTPKLWQVYQDYQNALLAGGGIDYDDILLYARQILVRHEWIANIYRVKYKHVCVDEAQDLNKAQYEFIKALCGDVLTSVLMVGDPNQMIYGFNGSSADYLRQHYLADFRPVTYQLTENYRSSKAVIHAANKLKPYSQQESAAALAGGFTVTPVADELIEAQSIVRQIKYLLDLKTHDEIEGEISLTNMVVIARNRFIFAALEQALSAEQLPFTLKKTERRAESLSLFGQVLDYGIRVRLNPKDWVDGKKLCALLQIPAPLHWGEANLLGSFAQQVLHSVTLLPELLSQLLLAIAALDIDDPKISKFFVTFDQKLKTLAGESQRNADKAELEQSIAELGEFKREWTRFKQKGLGGSLQTFANAMALGQLAEDVVANGLTLSTVHTMKGLEKDIVFLIGMCEGVFPDYRATTEAAIDEERNSAFVAVTRAKRWLYISYPQQRTMPWGSVRQQQPSRFLQAMQE